MAQCSTAARVKASSRGCQPADRITVAGQFAFEGSLMAMRWNTRAGSPMSLESCNRVSGPSSTISSSVSSARLFVRLVSGFLVASASKAKAEINQPKQPFNHAGQSCRGWRAKHRKARLPRERSCRVGDGLPPRPGNGAEPHAISGRITASARVRHYAAASTGVSSPRKRFR